MISIVIRLYSDANKSKVLSELSELNFNLELGTENELSGTIHSNYLNHAFVIEGIKSINIPRNTGRMEISL